MQHLDSLNSSSITTHQQVQHKKTQALGVAAISSTSSPYIAEHDQRNSTISIAVDPYQKPTAWNPDSHERTIQADGASRLHEGKKKGGESDFNAPKEASNVQTIATKSSLSPNKAKTSAPLGSTAQDTGQHEIQTKRILNHVNELISFWQIGKCKYVTEIRQCTSSLFVLLYERLFDCVIDKIERSPDTPEKKHRNVTLVLEELHKRSYALTDISAEEVVKLNEDHVSRLIMVFVSIADDMKSKQQRAAAAEALERVPLPQAHLGYTLAEVPPPGMTIAPIVYTTGSPATATGLEFHLNQSAPLNRFFPGASPNLVNNDIKYPTPTRRLHQNSPPEVPPGYSFQYTDHGAPEGKEEDKREDYGIQKEVPPSFYAGIDYTKAGSLLYVPASPISKVKLVENWSREIVSPRVDSVDPLNNIDFPMRASGNKLLSSTAATPLRPNTSDIRHRIQKLSDAVQEQAIRFRTPGDTTVQTPSSTAVGNNSVEVPPAPFIAGVGPRPSPHSNPSKSHQTSPATATKPTALHSSSTKKPNAAQRKRHPTGRSSLAFSASSRPANIELSSLPPDEPPLTRAECRLLASHPYSFYSSEGRDRKIERLRASRFLNQMQGLLHQGIRRDYESRMAETRESLKRNINTSKRNMLDGMRWIRDENNKYRNAYAVMMEAAANDSRMAQRMMSEYTADLAKHYADSLHESKRMSAYLEDEKERQDMMNLVRYAQRVTSWQQQLAV